MTDPQPSCSEIAKDLITKHFGQASNSNYVQFEADIEQALLSERTTAYKAGMERAAEIAKNSYTEVPWQDEGSVAQNRVWERGDAIAKAIRTEANKEIK